MLHPAQSVVFIDTNVSDVQHLVNGVLPGVSVKVLAPDTDGIAQITDYLKVYPVSTVHVFSHGAPGALFLGNTQLNLTNLETHAQALQSWFSPQISNPTLLLYGCSVAAGDAGEEFIEKLHILTKAAIGASTTKVGNPSQGGSWNLNRQVANPTNAAVFNAAALESYSGVFAVSVSGLNNFTYTEGSSPVVVDNSINFSSTVNYNDGSLRFDLTNGTSADQLALTSSATPNAVGAISVVGADVYLGNGSGRDRIGSIDAVLDGTNGKDLVINFASPLTNSGFETGNLTGWTAFNQNYSSVNDLNGQSIPYKFGSGLLTTTGTGTIDIGAVTQVGTFSTIVQSSVVSQGSYALELKSQNFRIDGPQTNINQPTGNGSLHGPYIRSATFQAFAGDSITLDYSAQNGNDAYEVFGFLVGAGGDSIFGTGDDTRANLFSQRGDTQSFKEVSASIANSGNYQFEFVSGTYDQTGGLLVGASLYVDNVRLVSSTSVTDAVVATIAQQITFQNTSAAPDTTTRNLQVTVINSNNESSSVTSSGTVIAVDQAPNLTLPTGAIALSDGTAAVIAANLSLVDADGPAIGGARVSIGTGFKAGQDALGILGQTGNSGTVDGIAWAYNNSNGILTLTGSASAATYEAALRKVTFISLNDTAATAGARDVQFSIGTQLANPDNDHFYEFVTAPGIDWTEAKTAAENRSFFGLKGYLVTVTSAAEQAFVASKLNGLGWLGASDAATEGNWRWVTGPEAGQQFWAGLAAGGPVGGNFNNWAAGEPNNANDEDYAHFLAGGQWNDYANATYVDGYLVEYGGMPGDPVLNLIGNVSVTVNSVNDAPTGSVTLSGTATQGQILTATSSVADVDGLGTLNYRWQQSSDGVTWSTIAGATASTFTLTQGQVGQFVRSQVSFTDGGGSLETVNSNATAAKVANVNDAPTGGVTLSGTVAQGQILTVNTSNLSDADGLGTLSYQWQQSSDGVTWTTIAGATASTFTLTQGQVGQFVRSQVSFTDGGGSLETVNSNATAAKVANVNDAPTGNVTLSGTGAQGQTLTANTSNLSDADGLGTLNYQWQQSSDGTTWTAISGATASTFTLTQGQVGQFVRSQVSYTDGGGSLETVNSNATAAKVANVNDAPTGSVTLSGTGTQGSLLTATSNLSDADGLGTLNYQWQQSSDGITWATIAGATANTFTLGQAQVGQFVRSQVSYTDGGGTAESVLSNATAAKVANINDAPTGGVTIDGTVAQGQILTANTSTLADADGLGTLGYQWQQSSDGITWSNIDGATDVTFSPRNAQVGQFLQVSVSYTDGFGTAESLTSAPTIDSVEKFNATSDFNGDGSVDIFWRHQKVGESVFWLMDNVNFAGGDVLSPVISDVNWDIKALGDLNGDGKPDLVWQNKVTNQAAVWLMDGVNLVTGALLPNDAASGWKVVESGDFNNNGKDDILWRNANTGELAVWYMDGTNFVSGEFVTLNAGLDWEVGAVGDFTKDGKTDIFWENRITGANAFWEMDGTNFVSGIATTAAETIWQAKGSADFNQDGNLDLLWHNPSTGENALWIMDGTDLVAGVTTLPTTEVSWNPVV